jgi:purine-cytosine permease-like protein
MILYKLTAHLKEVQEFEREPVPPNKHKSWRSFLGMYAGEHTAGTEFVIGPLFVAHGAGAADLVLGLLVGNLLAVLSWAFVCAPIAVKERITLYYKLEKICGKNLTLAYNLVNGLMFCFLAGSMIAVSATAVGIPFDIPMAKLTDWLPNSMSWVVIVLIIGLVTTIVAMLGYEEVSRFANIASPWMVLVFLAAAIAVLPELGVKSLGDFWPVATTKIWSGIPLEGQSKFTFWHVMFFAWFCNMAMHIGMADLSILRYAKTWKAGFTSGGGMFVGHYLAWLASGILYAIFLQKSQNSLEFAPGPVAYYAAGIAGAVCVIIAGWTTANPTIYRAGLAIQAISPGSKTWKVTLLVGLITTTAACFPALVMRLLDFVALYGLVLMPMGAIIFIDFYLLPKLGLTSNLAEKTGLKINWAAAGTWLLTLFACLFINFHFGVEIFFLGLPGWFVAVALYIGLSYVFQCRSKHHMEQ